MLYRAGIRELRVLLVEPQYEAQPVVIKRSWAPGVPRCVKLQSMTGSEYDIVYPN